MSIAILIIATLFYISSAYYLYKTRETRTVINDSVRKQNEKLENEKAQLTASIEYAREDLERQNEQLELVQKKISELWQSAETQAQLAYQSKEKEMTKKAMERQAALTADYERQQSVLAERIHQESEKLKQIEAKQRAYIEAQQRQEELVANTDYYRLAIDNVACDDIRALREIQGRMVKKDVIDKIIYEAYYKPAYDILMSHLFKTAGKVCGIYKITDLTTGKAYIGQSVDIKERFKQHIKSSLAYGTATNKLYQTMQKSGQWNFTFEILEEVSRDKLNERETYWIEFYKTKDFGLNSTKGGS